MRKVLIASAATLFALSLAACNGDAAEETPVAEEPVEADVVADDTAMGEEATMEGEEAGDDAAMEGDDRGLSGGRTSEAE